MIPRSRGNLFSFEDNNNATTKADKSHAGGALHAKEELGWGGGAHWEWCSVGERGDWERLWVSAWCLREGFFFFLQESNVLYYILKRFNRLLYPHGTNTW